MTNEDLVYLVNAGNDLGMASMSNDNSFPALGVLALGTWLQNRMSDLEVVARDGAVRSNEQTIDEIARLKPMLVGVSTLCTSYKNSLEIAQAAREVGAKVVFGNDHASQNSIAILNRRQDVDYVLGAEFGELPLELLVRFTRGERTNPYTRQTLDPSGIPTLTLRDESGEVIGFDFNNPKMKNTISLGNPNSGYAPFFELLQLGGQKTFDPKRNGLDIFPIVNRNLYPADHWQAYLDNYLKKFWRVYVPKETVKGLEQTLSGQELNERGIELAKKVVTGVTTINRFRGCNRFRDPCVYCDISDLTPTRSTAERFWEESEASFRQVGANIQYECCDSFSSFPGIIKELAETKPPNLGFNPRFFVYCQARDLVAHPERVAMLKEIGVDRVNMGLDSMSDPTLKCMKGEKDSVACNRKAVELCNDAGIRIYASFPLGCQAETPNTLKETTEEVIAMLERGQLADAESQPYLPLAGNDYGRKMKKDGLWIVDPLNPDWPARIDLMSETAINRYSGVTYRQVLDSIKEIRSAAEQSRATFGSGVSSRDIYE